MSGVRLRRIHVSRGRAAGLAGLVILAGLALRLVPWGLPLWAHHVGGGVLWGAMTVLLVAALRPPDWGMAATLAAAAALDVTVEAVRLVHTPGLDAFRTTLAGQLLLGRIPSAWNLATYGVGILAGTGAMQGLTRGTREAGPTPPAPPPGDANGRVATPAEPAA